MKNINKKIKIFSLVFSLLVLGLLVYSIFNYSFLKNQINDNLNNQVIKYGYIAVFVLSFLLEISPQPFASAIIPFANGMVLGLDYYSLLISTILGVITSSFAGYFLGIYFGKEIVLKFTGEENYEKYYRIFKKYGKFGMALIAITPLPYFPIIAGVFKMDFFDFVFYAVIPRVVYFFVFGYVLNLFF